jgi:hypothetical protein
MLSYLLGIGRLLAFVASIVLVGSGAALAQAPVTDCDRLAANPTDARKAPSVPGVQFKQVRENLNAALQACSSAAQSYPNELRFRYQYARALQARDKKAAFQIFAQLAKANYAAAYDNVGWILISENNDYENAIKAFERGYALGDADCAVSLFEMINREKWAPENAGQLKITLLEKAAAAKHAGAIIALPIERAKQSAMASNMPNQTDDQATSFGWVVSEASDGVKLFLGHLTESSNSKLFLACSLTGDASLTLGIAATAAPTPAVIQSTTGTLRLFGIASQMDNDWTTQITTSQLDSLLLIIRGANSRFIYGNKTITLNGIMPNSNTSPIRDIFGNEVLSKDIAISRFAEMCAAFFRPAASPLAQPYPYNRLRSSSEQSTASLSAYPLASCKDWNGQIIASSGKNTSAAEMQGKVTEQDIKEFCDRQSNDSSKCLAEVSWATLTTVKTNANCSTGQLKFTSTSPKFNNHVQVQFPLPADTDTSCASGLPPIIKQFSLLCPVAAEMLDIDGKRVRSSTSSSETNSTPSTANINSSPRDVPSAPNTSALSPLKSSGEPYFRLELLENVVVETQFSQFNRRLKASQSASVSLRAVDWKKMNYPLLGREAGTLCFSPTNTVSQIQSVHYGSFFGDGMEEAVISVQCGSNGRNSLVYVFWLIRKPSG